MRLLVEKAKNNPSLLDVSELVRPELNDGKNEDSFRNYENNANPMQAIIKKTYLAMHTNQTVDFVRKKHDKWLKFDHLEATVMEALELLNNLVDESDPDIDLPNIVHAFQTAEQIREVHPDQDWFHLTGLIHDLGKIMAFYDEPQWGVVGDTFPVGCHPQKSIVFRDWSFKDNPDLTNPLYNTENGIYEKNCGLNKITMSWGHDEYLYRVLLNHKTTLPQEGLWMIRFHSFYPWHTGGDYRNLSNELDDEMLKWVQEFNKFDLYTKSSKIPNIEKLKPYYQGLVDKYMPGVIKF
ncbi:inositol oxygenase-like [Tigriopus californicus]|nr:inositol oxygenase-like [Tigriopus californicus]